MTVLVFSIAAFVLASIADVVILLQTRQHRKELSTQEARVRLLRQELSNDIRVSCEQALAAICYVDRRIREDVHDVLAVQSTLKELELQD